MSKNFNKSYLSSHLKQSIHDLNNIFTSSINTTEMLEKLILENKEAAKLVATIKSNSLRAVDIINTLELNSIKQKRNITLVDIATDIESTIKTTLPKDIKLKFRFGKQLNKVFANYTDLYRVFLNLIVNAIESIGNSGAIMFLVKNNRKKDTLLISIKDTGVGIPKQKIKNIFEEGYSTKDKKLNSGLGLSIVKKIINEHNGSIEVFSKLKSGTEFIITLPAAEKITIDKDTKNSSKILLVDDDQVILELFSDLLTSYNYKVVTAPDGKSALNKFKEDNFDLIIVDKTLPILDGVECIRQIREMNLLMPIILSTGSQEAMEEDYSNLKINYKIKKPWSFESMLKVIQTLLT